MACPVVLSPNPCLWHLSFSPSPTSLRWRPCPCLSPETPAPLCRRACASVTLCETSIITHLNGCTVQVVTISVNGLSSVGHCKTEPSHPGEFHHPRAAMLCESSFIHDDGDNTTDALRNMSSKMPPLLRCFLQNTCFCVVRRAGIPAIWRPMGERRLTRGCRRR
jgi:hypothetical protein